jgi:hypothetical protein
MVQLRKLAYKAIDSISDRFDHLVAALDEDVTSAAIPERVRAFVVDSGADLLAGSTVVEGFDDGGLTDRPFSHTGVPLLSSFYFRYIDTDHHILQILVFPDWIQDVIRLGYHDVNSDDDYFFKIIHQITDGPGILRFSRSLDICSESECTVPIERPTGDFVFVLIGFQLSFHGDDHHINEVRIIESDGNLTVRFRDKHSAPPPISLWSLQYAYVPRSLFVELGTSSGSDRGAVGLDIPAGPSVIRGFSFDFRSDDHHLREIGVLTGSGRLEVYYADKNMDDLFDWAVDWGILAT